MTNAIAPKSQIIKVKQTGQAIDFSRRRLGLSQLLARMTRLPVRPNVVTQIAELFEKPNELQESLYACAPKSTAELCLVGPIESRIALLRDRNVSIAVSFGDYGLECLPSGVATRIHDVCTDGDQCWTFCDVGDVFSYVARPVIYLVALYHPEVFPLPRLSLAISDLIRASRREGVGRVLSRDMQLGAKVSELAGEIVQEAPDILGISATFGQHDVLNALLSEVQRIGWPQNCQLVFGGSLSVLNQHVLLDRFPEAVVATGPGEGTIVDLIRVHRDEHALEEVTGIAYRARNCGDPPGEIRWTNPVSPRDVDEMLPELDLLDSTLDRKGVMQLESSRGCSYACSFCPREHKGVWTGDDPLAARALLPDVERILARHPEISRKVFLVDEEFFGYRANGESERRVRQVANSFAEHGMRFETSSRPDQVYRRHENRVWHIDRFKIWRWLVDNSLDRCLFGIESGVDSILERFNKKTTGTQNSVAIRALSLLNVPPRYTYITFDPLMSRKELIATYRYLGRTDLLLSAAPEWDEAAIYDVAIDDALAGARTSDQRFYRAVSYMLVSIECLMGAPYTKEADAHGLLGEFNSNMGRHDVKYLDEDIGIFSDCAQRWVDRNFALDYLLKSIEKYSTTVIREQVHTMRVLIKDFAYDLLGLMIGLWDPEAPELHLVSEKVQALELHASSLQFVQASTAAARKQIVLELMDRHFVDMSAAMTDIFCTLRASLPEAEHHIIRQQLEAWTRTNGWKQINELTV